MRESKRISHLLENCGNVMPFRIQGLLCVCILILNAYLPIKTYMSLFTTEQTLTWTVMYYHVLSVADR